LFIGRAKENWKMKRINSTKASTIQKEIKKLFVEIKTS
jgi:hypothetical protein